MAVGRKVSVKLTSVGRNPYNDARVKYQMFRSTAISCAVLLISAASSRGGAILTFSQSGSNVLAQATGTLDTASLTLTGHGSSGGFLTPGEAEVGVGNFGTNNLYQGYNGPTSFGTGTIILSSSASGNIVGIEGGVGNFLIAPDNYVSGTALSGSATWDNTTISGLGLTPGEYTWTWGSGVTADSFEVLIPASVPEPSSMMLVGEAIGVFGFGAWIRRRRWPC
jgi:hypothetical protein